MLLNKMFTLERTQAICLLFFVSGAAGLFADNPCSSRVIAGESIVCVCNETYCDDITRRVPEGDTFVTYTSSKAGSRFNISIGQLQQSTLISDAGYEITLKLDPNTKFQTIEGFGGALTDSVGINWKNLSESLQQKLVDSYFNDRGIQYNFLRVPIGGSDFSTHPYAYNEEPIDDVNLSNFTLSDEDLNYKIPMIKSICTASSSEILILATAWCSPKWMKSTDKYSGLGVLKKEYYDTYAEYHLKFLKEYLRNGIKVWGITTTNEPVNGIAIQVKINALGWFPGDMGRWIINNLGPKIRNSSFSNLKIYTNDDQRYSLILWFDKMVKEYPKVLDYIDGIAVHFYADKIVPSSVVEYISKKYPNKPILGTEACEGWFPFQKKVILGSWSRAEDYISDIITDLNVNFVGWIDWNLCLNSEGGPNWSENFVDSPIIVFPEANEFVKQPMFYALGHVSKFLPKGSIRIGSKESKSIFQSSVQHVAFITPEKTITVILYNKGSKKNIKIQLGSKTAIVNMEASSITTLELPYINPKRL